MWRRFQHHSNLSGTLLKKQQDIRMQKQNSRVMPLSHYGCMQPACRSACMLHTIVIRSYAACIRSSTLCMSASTPCILRRRRRDADRNNTPWMNMSILGVFLRSYFSIFSHDLHSTPIPRSAVVQRRVLSYAENAQDGKVDELAMRACDRPIIKFVERVRSHPTGGLWESRHDD